MTPRLLHLQSRRLLGTFAGLMALCLTLWVATPHFLTVSNLLNVLEQTAINAIVAVGMTFVIISGGIDLSVGFTALSGIALGSALQAGAAVPVAIALALAVGLGCGLVNGVLVTFGRLPPFIATLGMMSVRGAALMLAEGRPISGFDDGFRMLATGRVLMMPAPVIIAGLIYAVAHFVLGHTVFGRDVCDRRQRRSRTVIRRARPLSQDRHLRSRRSDERRGCRHPHRAAELSATDGRHHVRARRDRGDRDRRNEPAGGRRDNHGRAHRRAHHGCAEERLNLLNVSSFQQVVIGVVIIGAVLVDMSLKRHRR